MFSFISIFSAYSDFMDNLKKVDVKKPDVVQEEIYNQIQAAAKKVLVEQKLDAIVDYRVIFVGGIDVTNLVITKLKTGK